MNLDEVAVLLDKSPRSVKEDLRRNPQAVPPRLIIPGGRRLLWRRTDVKRWLEALPTMGGAVRDPEWGQFLDAS